MKRDGLHEKIRAAYESATPDLISAIEEECKSTEQLPERAPDVVSAVVKKKSPAMIALKAITAICACLCLFISGLGLGRLIPVGGGGAPTAETFVYFDVNPSIEVQISEDGRVVLCEALNEDAEAILAELKLEGVDMNTAVTAIVGSLYLNGYLAEDSNSILISVDAGDGAPSSLLTEITERVAAAVKGSSLECSVIAQSVEVDDTLRERARENGISVGKMRFLDKMVEGIEELTDGDLTELAEMTISELNLLYSSHSGANSGGNSTPGSGVFDDDVTHGTVGGYVGHDGVIESLISGLEISAAEIGDIEFRVEYERGEGGRGGMVYRVTVELPAQNAVYDVKINCKTGEIISSELLPDEDIFPDIDDIFPGLDDLFPGLGDGDGDDGHGGGGEPDDNDGEHGDHEAPGGEPGSARNIEN